MGPAAFSPTFYMPAVRISPVMNPKALGNRSDPGFDLQVESGPTILQAFKLYRPRTTRGSSVQTGSFDFLGVGKLHSISATGWNAYLSRWLVTGRAAGRRRSRSAKSAFSREAAESSGEASVSSDDWSIPAVRRHLSVSRWLILCEMTTVGGIIQWRRATLLTVLCLLENLAWGYGDLFNLEAPFEEGFTIHLTLWSHFTQIVWRNMKELGCAIASCRYGDVRSLFFFSPPSFQALTGVLDILLSSGSVKIICATAEIHVLAVPDDYINTRATVHVHDEWYIGMEGRLYGISGGSVPVLGPLHRRGALEKGGSG
ncbi:hypothetical protein L218DRAFT_948145 [Marasmius fiardii PR-910]|nr:hypothetical protein L218DRAFT_948145 [Marasmius fiardii PR-910]